MSSPTGADGDGMTWPLAVPIDYRRWTPTGLETGARLVPEEVPIAIRINCTDYAVMLATPADVEDFVYGFLRTEGLIQRPSEIAELTLSEQPQGMVARVEIPRPVFPAQERVRRLAGISACGLCGIESLRDVVRPVPAVGDRLRLGYAAISRAVQAMHAWQPVGAACGALHAAAFATTSGEILLAREDVGRHNTLDKLIGALFRRGMNPAGGFLVLTSRCSFELVQKAAAFGIELLCTAAPPTGLAVRLAEQAGMTLVSTARADSFLVVTGEQRFEQGDTAAHEE